MASKKKAGRVKVLFAFILLFGPASVLILIGTRNCEHKFKELDDYGEMKSYSFTDVSGKHRTSSEFKNNIVLINVLKTTCPEKCDISLWHLDQLIYQKIRKNKTEVNAVKILSFVVDKDGNPIESLEAVQDMLFDRVESYDPEIWILASGDPYSLYNFEHKGFNLTEKGDPMLSGENYLQRMLLVDKYNHLRMVRSGKLEAYVRESYGYIALLLKQYDKEIKNTANQD